ncbi:uncharacterized protein [Magallana gigas]|uniref:Uncharacterized protein n=1 Tax=Magallana gigas TaxID=29159 RepID=A0A8W8LYY3_MAGGI|nr:uncharacterized protein LOC105331740 [Crassostrea gigas]
MSTLEVDHSSLDVVASWFGQTLPKKRKIEDVKISEQNKKGKHKKLNKGSQNGTGTLTTSDRTVHSRDITPGKVRTLPQGEGHSEDATDLSVSSFIQGKINKKLLKASHKKREQGLSIPGKDKGEVDLNRKIKRHGHVGQDSSSEGEEESRLGLITKQRPAQRSVPDSAKKRKRKRKKKSSET